MERNAGRGGVDSTNLGSLCLTLVEKGESKKQSCSVSAPTNTMFQLRYGFRQREEKKSAGGSRRLIHDITCLIGQGERLISFVSEYVYVG